MIRQTTAEYVAALHDDSHVTAIALTGGYAMTRDNQSLPFTPAKTIRESRHPDTSRVRTGLYIFPDKSTYEIRRNGSVKTDIRP